MNNYNVNGLTQSQLDSVLFIYRPGTENIIFEPYADYLGLILVT